MEPFGLHVYSRGGSGRRRARKGHVITGTLSGDREGSGDDAGYPGQVTFQRALSASICETQVPFVHRKSSFADQTR